MSPGTHVPVRTGLPPAQPDGKLPVTVLECVPLCEHTDHAEYVKSVHVGMVWSHATDSVAGCCTPLMQVPIKVQILVCMSVNGHNVGESMLDQSESVHGGMYVQVSLRTGLPPSHPVGKLLSIVLERVPLCEHTDQSE